ncbi:MAG: DUF3592 domain-containing protein [Anaerolineae bacterium]|nr:DUF3592 domain-containing protein [Anaerolineae bacterium]MCI0611270.1 DUF3592 domain-containing protein [Anaerolineae bacterium]
MQNQSPSLFRVISTDYSSYLSVLFPIVFGGFAVYFFFIGNDALQLFSLLAIGAIVIGGPLLFQRYRTISSVFTNGTPTQAVITSIGFFRGRGRVEYSYTFRGEKHTSSNAINRNSRTRNLRVGQTVKVFVDPDNHKQAFIREIYM